MKGLIVTLLILPTLCMTEDAYSGSTAVTPESKIQKCKSPEGKITLSNVGCDAKEKAERLEVTPNVVDSSDLRSYARRNPAKAEVASPKATSKNPPFQSTDATQRVARPSETFIFLKTPC